MQTINKIQYRYPELDMSHLAILLLVDEHPGLCIREVAEILVLDPKFAQQKIAQLCTGRRKYRKLYPAGKRKTRQAVAYGLIDAEYNLADKRKRSLATTEAGRELIGELENWRVGE